MAKHIMQRNIKVDGQYFGKGVEVLQDNEHFDKLQQLNAFTMSSGMGQTLPKESEAMDVENTGGDTTGAGSDDGKTSDDKRSSLQDMTNKKIVEFAESKGLTLTNPRAKKDDLIAEVEKLLAESADDGAGSDDGKTSDDEGGAMG